jgi:hypothetical protein
LSIANQEGLYIYQKKKEEIQLYLKVANVGDFSASAKVLYNTKRLR